MESHFVTRTFRNLSVILSLFFIHEAAVAGGSSSHGGDNRKLLDIAAWFPRYEATKNRIVVYCYILDPKFSIQEKDRIEAAIETAYQSWYDYVSATENKTDIQWASKDKEVKLITAASSCNEDVDLKFYFAHTNDKIKAEIQTFTNPATFSHMESRDPKTAWAKGYVWFHPANDDSIATKFIYSHIASGQDSPLNQLKLSITWKAEGAFELAVKHEMGHIFGFQHLEDTIMDVDFLKWMPAPGLGHPKSIPFLGIDKAKAILERTVEEWPIVVEGMALYNYLSIEGLTTSHANVKATLRIDNDKVSLEGKYKGTAFKLNFEEVDDTLLSKFPRKSEMHTALVSCMPREYRYFGETTTSIHCIEVKQTAQVKEFRLPLVDPEEFKERFRGAGLPYASTHHHFLISRNMVDDWCRFTPYAVEVSEASVFKNFHKAFHLCPMW